MAPPIPLHQCAVFYTGCWTEQVDAMFIDTLITELWNGHYRAGRHNHSAMTLAATKLNARFGTSFDVAFFFSRFWKLRERYNVFNWITRLSGVVHEPISNHIECSQDAWEFICEKEPLARAYMLCGEKQFDGLKLLFQEGPDPPEFVVNVDEVEVIDLSSDHEEGIEVVPAGEKGKGAAVTVECGKKKIGTVIGGESEPDNQWWAEVGTKGHNFSSDEEVSLPSEFSSTEHCKKWDHIEVASSVSRRLWADGGSSSASFSPSKKI